MITNVYASFFNYDLEIYRRFIGSLIDTGFTGKMNIFMIDANAVYMAQKLYDEFKYKSLNFIIIEDHAADHSKPHMRRFIDIDNCLANPTAETYGYSLICDSRDVLFQSNPQDLKFDEDYDLYVYQEGVTLEQEPKHNGKWANYMHSIYGDVDYLDQPVLCVGGLVIKSIQLKKFTSYFSEAISKLNLENTIMDQGLFNYLFYKNQLPIKSISVPNINNAIYHVGMGLDRCIYRGGKLMLENNKNIPAIIHQYDRLPESLLQKLSIKYDFVRKI